MIKRGLSYFRTHTFSKIILSFVAILAFGLSLLGTFSYTAYRSSLLESAVENSRSRTKLIEERIDGEIGTLHSVLLSILSNSTLSNFESFSKSTSPDSQFRLKNMMDQIVYLENSYTQLESIWLYCADSRQFITRYGCFSEEEFFGTRNVITTTAGRPIADALEDNVSFRYLCTSQIQSYYESAECFTFMRSVSGYRDSPAGQILLNVKSETLTDILENAGAGEEQTLLLLDQEGVPIASSQSDFPTDEYTAEMHRLLSEGEDKPLEVSIGGIEYTAWLTVSPDTQVQYVSLINRGELLKRVDGIRWVTLGLCAVCLGISVVLAFSLTNRLFAPIQKIVRYVRAELGQSELENYHDVLLIEKFIDYMKSQNTQLQEHIDSYTGVMREAVLTEYLYSREQQPVMEQCREGDFPIEFAYEYFTAAVIPFSQPGYARGKTDSAFLMPEISGIREENKFSSLMQIWYLRQSEYLILVFNTKEGQALIERFFADVKIWFEKREFPLLYAYGKTYSSVTGLYDSFHQAVNILMVKPDPFRGKGGYESAINAQYITSRYSQETEARLVDLVKNRAPEAELSALLHSIIEENREGGASLIRLESLFVQLLITLIHITSELNVSVASVFGGNVNLYWELEHQPDIGKKEDYILQAYAELTRYAAAQKPSKPMEICRLMLEYVEKHYMEDISLNDISYQLELSPSYLSSVFKDYQHTTFLSYINQYRIEKAKPLLLHSQESIASVAQSVGYANVNTFIRIFKKEEGVTPGQFRAKG